MSKVFPDTADNAQRERRGVFIEVDLGPAGRGPGLPAFTPAKDLLVVPNELTSNASLVSCSECRVVATVALPPGGRPWQAKVHPNGNVAYITNSRFGGTAENSVTENSTVSVLAIKDLRVIAEIPVGAGPNGVTMLSTGKIALVANMRSDDVSVIDAVDHREIKRVPVGRAPSFVKMTKDNAFALVTNLTDSSLSIVDTDDWSVRTLVVGVPELNDSYPQWGSGDTVGVSVTSRGLAFVTNWRSHEIVVVDVAAAKVVHRAPSTVRFPFGVEVDEGLGIVLISSGVERRFSVLDMRTFKEEESFAADGTSFPVGRAARLNLWMTDPERDRLGVLLPLGPGPLTDDPARNIVTKFM